MKIRTVYKVNNHIVKVGIDGNLEHEILND